MYSSRQQNKESAEVVKLREECGAWLRGLREAVNISQREFASALGLEYYSFISQIESGKGRVPTHQIKDWARILKVPSRDFARNILRFYDPVNYALLFSEEEDQSFEAPKQAIPERAPHKVVALNTRVERLEQKALEDRVNRLEALLMKNS